MIILIVILLLGMFSALLHLDAQEAEKVYRIGFLGLHQNKKRMAKEFLQRFRE